MSLARNLRSEELSDAWRWGGMAAAITLALAMAACGQPASQGSSATSERSASPAPAGAPDAQTHEPTPSPVAIDQNTHAPGATHQDHDSKHGGAFFMALDEKHHLEGVLTQPDTFRVYLFDEYSKPLIKDALANANATVTWGNAENSPEVALRPAADGLTLEAKAPAKVTFPTELTLRIRFPGAPANSRPELFTFPFQSWTHSPATRRH